MTRSIGSRFVLEARERAELARHLGRGRVGDAGHDGGERAGTCARPSVES